ncbi:helix-turn-helix transcriptional regulator [Verrucomicrobiota bacterium sgz303538]
MLYIHEELRNRRYPNAATLRKKFGVARFTTYRDIDFMRDNHNLPIAYDQLRNGFYYTREDVAFPNVQLSTGELMGLCVAHMAIEPHRGTMVERQLRSALEKITRGMTEEIRVHWDELASVISFRGNDGVVKVDMDLFQKVSEASVACEEIEFGYTKMKSRTEEKRLVRPYHLTNVANAWYLLAVDVPADDVRIFALSRMRKLKRTGVKFKKDRNIRPDDYLAHSIGIFSGGKPQRVRLRATGVALRIFQERRWHASQKVVAAADGSEGDVTMEVAITPELERFILGWGAELQVLSPAPLVKAIAKTAREMMGRY